MHKSGVGKPDRKSSDPADVPMGSNRLSPSEQAKAIAYDVAIMEGTAPIMPRNRTGTIANLRKDSDEGRYAAPGYGDQGQFAGGSGSGGAKPNTDEELTSGKSAMKKGGMAKSAKFMSFSKKGKPAGMKPVTKMASGGSASSRADGIAVKGKTRGKMC